jgi:hypothetical protein
LRFTSPKQLTHIIQRRHDGQKYSLPVESFGEDFGRLATVLRREQCGVPGRATIRAHSGERERRRHKWGGVVDTSGEGGGRRILSSRLLTACTRHGAPPGRPPSAGLRRAPVRSGASARLRLERRSSAPRATSSWARRPTSPNGHAAGPGPVGWSRPRRRRQASRSASTRGCRDVAMNPARRPRGKPLRPVSARRAPTTPDWRPPGWPAR